MNNNVSISTVFALITILLIGSCTTSKPSSMNNMVARMEVTEPIEGVCDNDNVIVVLPFSGNGQVEAKAPITDEELTIELNKKVIYLADKKEYKDKGMVGIIVNCKGEMVQCEIDNKTKSPELDEQIVSVFSKMKHWTAATFGKQSVDSRLLYSFTIEKGKISLN